MFDLSNEEGRTEYLIDKRKKNIKLFNDILDGKVEEYKNNMNSEVFINDVKRHLKIETDLLNDLINDK